MGIVYVPYKANTVIIRQPSDIKSFGVTGFGRGLPPKIKNAHDYLRYVGIKLSGSSNALKHFRLSSEQLGELYFRLFINRVDTLIVKTADFDLQDLLALPSEKFSFIPQKGPRPRLIQSGQEIALPEKIILRVQFSHPRDITKRVEMINALIQTIEQAEKSIYVAMFSFTNETIAQSLIAAANRGIDVRVIMDKAQASLKNSQHQALKDAGIKVLLGDLTLHHKFTIIDERGVFSGSINMTKANERNYEDLTYIGGEGEAAKHVQRFLERFLKLYRTFSLGLGTLVKPENPLLQGLEFGHTLAPLDLVKELEIRLTRITEFEHLELIDLLRTKQFKFRVKKVELLRPLFEGITPESNYLINALLHNKKIINSIPLRFFFEAASPSKKYHKSNVNIVGGLPKHTKEAVAWGKALSVALELPDQTQNEINAAAACHNIYPGIYRKGYAPRDRAKLAADLLQDKLKDFMKSLDEDALEGFERVIESIRNCLGPWGGTPLGPANSMNDWGLCLAKYLASQPNIFIFESEISPEKEQEIIGQLLERPLPDPRKTYLPILEKDENLRSLLKQVTGRASFSNLDSEDERILDSTYSLLRPFLLSEKDAAKGDKEQEKAILKKKKTIKTVLMASLLVRHQVQGVNRLADIAQSIQMNLTPKTNKLLWPICIANWIAEQKNMRVFSYGDVRWALRNVETKEKEWIEKEHDPSELRKFTLDLQDVMFDELSHEFVPEVEEQLRKLIAARYRIKLDPIAGDVIIWMIQKAGTLQADKIYKSFLGSLKSKARKQFIKALRTANMDDFDIMVIKKLEAELEKRSLPAGKILHALGRGYRKESRKTAKEISAVLHNVGVREAVIENLLEDVYKLKEKRISIEEINDLLVKHKLPLKTIKIICRSLLEFEPWQVENPPQGLDRVLAEDFKVGERERGEIFIAFKEIIRQEAEKHIQSLCEQRNVSRNLPQSRVLPEFKALAKAFFDMGKTNINETLTWLRSTRDLSFRDYPKEAMKPAVKIVNQSVERGERILVCGEARLNGVLSVALLVETLRDLGMPKELIGYHIPDMSSGLTIQEIQQKYKEGYRTIIASPADIKSGEAIAEAKKLGMQVLMIDEQPYKFARSLLDDAGIPKGGLFLDLAALGALASVGPLTQKDRNIVHWGLRVLNSLNRNIGLDTLMGIRGIKEKPMDGAGVRSQLIPTLEIGGEEVVKLLLAEDKTEALVQVEKLMNLEKEERAKDKGMQPGREKIKVKVVSSLPLNLISVETNTLFKALAPFKGEDELRETDKPIFVIEGQLEDWLPEGKDNNHLMFWIKGGTRFFARRGNNMELKKILFENQGKKIKIAFTLETRLENGKEDIRPRLIDIIGFTDKGEK